MAKFILIYTGPATPMDQIPPEAGAGIQQAWGSWIGKHEKSLVDLGSPFGVGAAVKADGSTGTAAQLNGYTIVEADDLESAKAFCDGHPFLQDASDAFSVDVYELLPMEM